MQINANGDNIELIEEQNEIVKAGAIEYYIVNFTFDSAWDGLTKKAVLIEENAVEGEEIAVINNQVSINADKKGSFAIGLVGYTEEDGVKAYQISTNLQHFRIDEGAGEINTIVHTIPSASEWEIYIAQIEAMCGQSYTKQETDELLEDKVDKIEGMGLSENNFSNEFVQDVNDNTRDRHIHSNKDLLDTYNQTNANLEDAVSKKHTHTNKAVLDDTTASYTIEEKSKLGGLENYDDSEIREEIEEKVDKVDGKGLSTNDYTTTEKSNVANNTSARHTHSNKDTLDNIEEAYTTTEKNKLASLHNYDDSEIQSALENKVDKITGKSLVDDTEIARLANVDNYDDTEIQADISNLETNKANTSDIPSKTSDLTNDSGFITNAVNNLSNYTNNTNLATTIRNTRPVVKTTLDNPAQVNTIYDLGEQTNLAVNLPTGQLGDFIQVDFLSTNTPTVLTLTASSSALSDVDLIPETNKIYSLFFVYGRLETAVYGWKVAYSENTRTVV